MRRAVLAASLIGLMVGTIGAVMIGWQLIHQGNPSLGMTGIAMALPGGLLIYAAVGALRKDTFPNSVLTVIACGIFLVIQIAIAMIYQPIHIPGR